MCREPLPQRQRVGACEVRLMRLLVPVLRVLVPVVVVPGATNLHWIPPALL